MVREPTATPELVAHVRRVLEETGSMTLRLRIRPGRHETRVAADALADADIVLDVAAPPVDDRANIEVQRFVAELAGVPRNAVEIVVGRTSPRKVLRITRSA